MTEADARRERQFAGSPDLAIWHRFRERTRAFHIEPIAFEPWWIERTSAEYVITASYCHNRFLDRPPPSPNHPFFEGFTVRRDLYAMLLSDDEASPFRTIKCFDEGSGPIVTVLRRARSGD